MITSTESRPVLRAVVMLVLGSALAFAAPAGDAPLLLAVAAVVIAAAVLAQLIGRASERRRRLLMTAAEELTKLRRIYHLAKHLSSDAPKYRTWFTDLHGFLVGYLGFFADKDFSRYDESDAQFRKLSYHIYAVPDLEKAKESVLFTDLLATAAAVAAERQHVKELRRSQLASSGWMAVAMLVALAIFAVLLATADVFSAKLAAAAVVSMLLMSLGLLKELDSLAGDLRALAGRYADNIGRLELARRE